GPSVEFVEDPRAALEGLLVMSEPGDTICVTGSIYLIGLLRNRWFPEEQLLAERRISYAAI
ncbi:MAG TPA: hypothetical protein VFZ12_03555, partial [Dehalococcoidia bacterium]|nr:hypothetical protein [Dehalococcoidia bacterium]